MSLPPLVDPEFDARYYRNGGADVAPEHDQEAAAAARLAEFAEFQWEQQADPLPSTETIELHASASVNEVGWVKDELFWVSQGMDAVVAEVQNSCMFCLGDLVVEEGTGGQPSIAVSILDGAGWTSMRCKHVCHYFCVAKWKATKHSERYHGPVTNHHTHGWAIPCPAPAPCPVCREDFDTLGVFRGNTMVPMEAMED